MINTHEYFKAISQTTSDQLQSCLLSNTNVSSNPQYCPIPDWTIAFRTMTPITDAMCSTIVMISSYAVSEFSSSAFDTLPSAAPGSSFLGHILERQEPLLVCNFDINPHTSGFPMVFLTNAVCQVLGFFLVRQILPRITRSHRKDQRALSWVLTLFSSIVLFMGAFTLSSDIEWKLFAADMATTTTIVGQTASFVPLQNFLNESILATMYSAYFVSYLICDLVLGMIYYREFLGLLSGWFHHLVYIAAVSNASLQKNVSMLFAIGTPIEASTIVLATGHTFPELCLDTLFAITFILSRIVYPLVLLPELYMNVESRLYWKVAAMTLVVHLYWFIRFVQQQVRYYRARQVQKLPNVEVIEQEKSTASTPETGSSVVNEEPCPLDSVVNSIKTTLSPTEMIASSLKNDMSEMDQAVFNGIQVNGSRHRMCRAVRRSACPSFDTSCDSQLGHERSESDANGSKTMEQLLAECELDDVSSYMLPLQGLKGNNSRTFSPIALSRLMSSQDSNGVAAGAVRLSRASSMRDSRRRTALDAVRFEEPAPSMAPIASRSPSMSQIQIQTQTQAQIQVQFPKTNKAMQSAAMAEGGATVVMRRRPSSRAALMTTAALKSSLRSKADSSGTNGCDYDLGTIRVARGVSVNA
ncbi:hypothetical protein BG011_005571 [Mortierella polycephala]|uniref:TLC domain-containing protein n=1 Tax=Mortierella polycephala TaxID=41804 RepID=A0A9P6U138_9FUNG|nr:hypothetical protein BG011_005571 [Mortierella polycephala]